MKLTNRIRDDHNASPSTALNACVAACRKAAAQLQQVKEAIFTEFRGTLDTQEQLLRLALNEAEALAWQTTYPHLVFATLATEKVQAVADWTAHQRQVTNRLVSTRPAVRR